MNPYDYNLITKANDLYLEIHNNRSDLIRLEELASFAQQAGLLV